jgi:predicted phosphodiesterase
MDDPRLVPVIAEVAASFAWTAGVLSRDGHVDRLGALPTEHRVTTRTGVRILAVHASPRADDGPGIDPRRSDAELADLLAGCDADVVFAGHTHRPVDRPVGAVRAVNLGSVSNPVAADLRASYVIVDTDADADGTVQVEHRRVAYDCDAVIDALDRLRHPGRAWLIAHHRGEVA